MKVFHDSFELSSLPSTGFIGNCGTDFGYGNPGTGYYWSSTGIDRSNAYASANDNRLNVSWPIQEGYAIRPVKEDIDITGVEVGMVIGANGKFYADKDAAETAGTTAEAMVAYLGTEAEGAEHGLAIALEDASNKLKSFDGVASTFSEWESNHTVKVGTWRLPSVSDFQLMFRGCGSESIYTTDLTEGMGFDYGNFPTKITDAGGNGVQVYYYWCSLGTQNSDTWAYTFSDKVFRCSGKAGDNYIRAVLAF